MMSVAPTEAAQLSWWEYQALLWTWNDRHTPEGESEADAPDAAFVDKIFGALEKRGLVSESIH